MHVAVPGVETEAGVQVKPLTLGGGGGGGAVDATVTTPPVEEVGIASPFNDTANASIWIGRSFMLAERVKVTIATTPSASVLLFTPTARQV